ncbi:MAG: hypothetical protein AB1331_06845 [Bacillota bacterium]
MIARCPNCGSRTIGRVGTAQYYCWDCCIEFVEDRAGQRMFRIEEDGSVVELAGEEVRG